MKIKIEEFFNYKQIKFNCCSKQIKKEVFNPIIICNCNNTYLLDLESKVTLDSLNYEYNCIFIDRIYTEKFKNIFFKREILKQSKKLIELLETTKIPMLEDLMKQLHENRKSIKLILLKFLELLNIYNQYFTINYEKEFIIILNKFLKELCLISFEIDLMDLNQKYPFNLEQKNLAYINFNNYSLNSYDKQKLFQLFGDYIFISGINIKGKRIFMKIENYF